jgi:phosphoribosylformimino-5-aminoimidazole carboxamide ribotide isomerase
MEIIPAIDLRNGQVVRLRQGDYSQQTSYNVEPLVLARQYAANGVRWLHVVDLDGARDGSFGNLDTIEALAAVGLEVQAGGGVRSDTDVDRLLGVGVSRVVVGSTAVRDPDRVGEWIARFGAGRICIALDVRDDAGAWRLPTDGWTRADGSTLDQLAPRIVALGARHALCTDISRDGTLSGPNLALYAHLRGIVPDIALQASGGVRDVADVRALRQTGVSGVILGRSLLEGRLTLAEALAC